MQSILVFAVALLPLAASMEAPVGKCKEPLPSFPGLNISEVTGQMMRYVYTPKSVVYKGIDNIAMMIKEDENKEDDVYTEILRARSIFGSKTTMKFKVHDLGDGILEKVSEDEDLSYIASIVDIQDDVALLYVCSEDGDEKEGDSLYIIAREGVDKSSVGLPNEVFPDAFEKYGFESKFWRLPQRFPIKPAKFLSIE